jgi:hypothetical protein
LTLSLLQTKFSCIKRDHEAIKLFREFDEHRGRLRLTLGGCNRPTLAFADVGDADPTIVQGFLPERNFVVAAGNGQHVTGNGPRNCF